MGTWGVALIVGVLQLGSVGRARVVRAHEVAESTDAGTSTIDTVEQHGSGREPAAVRDLEPPAERPAAPAQAPSHAPWWVYAMLLVPVTVLFGAVAWAMSTPRLARPHRVRMGGEAPAVSSAPPRTVVEYAQYLGDAGATAAPQSSDVKRTPEECHKLYVEGLERFVKRQVWPEVPRWIVVPDAPVETRWRAWIGGERDYDRAVVRASGRTQGEAMKRLLRSYNTHGGAWVAHALSESDRAASPPSA